MRELFDIKEDDSFTKSILKIFGSGVVTNLLLCFLIVAVVGNNGWLNIIHKLLVANT